MEKRDLDLIQTLARSNWEMQRLLKAHQRFEEEIGALERQPVLTPLEEQRKKDLQKQKLRGKDRMFALCDHHRRNGPTDLSP